MKNSDKYIKKLDGFLGVYHVNDKLHLTDINFINELKQHLINYKVDLDNSPNLSLGDATPSPYEQLILNIKEKLEEEINRYDIIDDSGNVIFDKHTNSTVLSHEGIRTIIQVLNNEFERLKLLEVINDKNKNIVLLGANGSGKSSFANFLKGTSVNNICVLPAQKILQIVNGSAYDYQASIEKVQTTQMGNKAKGSVDLYYSGADFTHLITALVNADVQLLINKENFEISKDDYNIKSPLIKLKRIFSQLIPDIEFKSDANTRLLNPIKNGQQYELENLSDGEKSLLYYIGNILLSSKNSFVIVDEPETYINPSIYKKLWDLLITTRNDCQFIFITHSMDFIISRNPDNTNFFWIKSFSPPENWKIEKLPKIDDIPKILIAELAASKKTILFCEGNYDSFDYHIYSILFGAAYTIQPVGGHIAVISYTKSLNFSCALGDVKAIGIIDGDSIPMKKKEEYKINEIYVLPFNEIEMLLLFEPIIKLVVGKCYSSQIVDEKIKDFKCEFFNSIKNNKEKIITAAIKKEVDLKLENYRIQKFKTINDIIIEVSSLKNILPDIEELNTEKTKIINDNLQAENFLELLKLCNLKGEILNGLGNRYIESDYAIKAKNCIEMDESIQNHIIERFFPELIYR